MIRVSASGWGRFCGLSKEFRFAVCSPDQQFSLSWTNRYGILPTIENSRGMRRHITNKPLCGYIRLFNCFIPTHREDGFTIGRKNGSPYPVIVSCHEDFRHTVGSIYHSNGIITCTKRNRFTIWRPGDPIKSIIGHGMRK